jgi:hypothetical protein
MPNNFFLYWKVKFLFLIIIFILKIIFTLKFRSLIWSGSIPWQPQPGRKLLQHKFEISYSKICLIIAQAPLTIWHWASWLLPSVLNITDKSNKTILISSWEHGQLVSSVFKNTSQVSLFRHSSDNTLKRKFLWLLQRHEEVLVKLSNTFSTALCLELIADMLITFPFPTVFQCSYKCKLLCTVNSDTLTADLMFSPKIIVQWDV